MEGLFNYKVSKVCSIYDGDTMTVDLDLGFNMVMKNKTLRLYGINTPEVRGPEKEEGKKVRDYVRELVKAAEAVFITSHYDKAGKYGRILATVILLDKDGIATDLNQHLLDMDMAKEYMR